MNKKVLFGVSLLIAAMLIPAASAAVDASFYQFWGEKEGNLWHTDGLGDIYYSYDVQDPDQIDIQADPITYNPLTQSHLGDIEVVGGTLLDNNFAIYLPNTAEEANYKIIEAWWWFNYSPPSDNLEVMLLAPASVGSTPTTIETLVAPQEYQGSIDDLNNRAMLPRLDDEGDLDASGEPFEYRKFGDDNSVPLYYAKWKVNPQVHNEWLVWQSRDDNEWLPCDTSQFYVESTCAPGLPAFALIGIPPVLGALFRKLRTR